MNYVVIEGFELESMTVHGGFHTEEEAEKWAKKNIKTNVYNVFMVEAV